MPIEFFASRPSDRATAWCAGRVQWNKASQRDAATTVRVLAHTERARLPGPINEIWIADFRRLLQPSATLAAANCARRPPAKFNRAMRIDTKIVTLLERCPFRPSTETNLAFRPTCCAEHGSSRTGQQMVTFLKNKGNWMRAGWVGVGWGVTLKRPDKGRMSREGTTARARGPSTRAGAHASHQHAAPVVSTNCASRAHAGKLRGRRHGSSSNLTPRHRGTPLLARPRHRLRPSLGPQQHHITHGRLNLFAVNSTPPCSTPTARTKRPRLRRPRRGGWAMQTRRPI